MTSYVLHHPAPHVTLHVRREPLAGVPGFRAACSCGESCWRHSEDQIVAWEWDHAHIRETENPAQRSGFHGDSVGSTWDNETARTGAQTPAGPNPQPELAGRG